MLRDISVCVSSLEPDHALIRQAADLASLWSAHLSCCAIIAQPMPAFTDGLIGTQSVLVKQIEASEQASQAYRSELRAFLDDSCPGVELRETRNFISGFAEVASLFSRYADVLLARMPAKHDSAHHAELIEGALFGGGRPVIALPEDWKASLIGKRVLLAWDASREASRAVHDALPLLAEGAEVLVVTIDAQTGPRQHGDQPGMDIAAHLARHGLRVTVRNEDSLGKQIGERLVEAANGFGADMIVMGAYRHAKLFQRIVEGPSQFLISKSPVPVFLSH